MSQASARPQDERRPDAGTAPPPEGQDEGPELSNRFLLFNVMPSWMVSFITHLAVIIILAILVMPQKQERRISVEATERASETLDEVQLDLDALELDAADTLETADILPDSPLEVADEMELALPEAEVEIGYDLGMEESLDASDMLGELSAADETSARTGESKKAALMANGGTQASEDAVALALEWIVKHQLEDGGWSLDHTIGPGNFRNSPNPGTRPEARAGATSLALLPLLGAGNTHMAGQYKKEVAYGLEFLKKRAQRRGRGISLLEPGGSMYSHGLAAIVFCEAYAMTKDPDLIPYAQGTVWFIEDSQDPIGGGWRYRPRERGDTSAVGWQLMALKSGKITGLNINPLTYKRAAKFLDGVSTSGGSFYGYMDPPRIGRADARTAVGLLCRMYMGWDRDVPGLVDGVTALSEAGPSVGPEANMYYNYYATQVMKHMYNGKREWKTWNNKMRDFLVSSQARDGDAAGSWHFGRDHASAVGGRLYNTALAAMTLEVYYRFLPLYGDKAASDQFELLD